MSITELKIKKSPEEVRALAAKFGKELAWKISLGVIAAVVIALISAPIIEALIDNDDKS